MNFLERVNQKILIFDGAMGTMLQASGLEAGECPELWNLNHAEEVRAVHCAYLEAGSDLILTNTFGGSKLKLNEYRLGDQTYDINRAAANLARKAAHKTGALAAGTVGPSGQYIKPFGPYSFEEVIDSFRIQIQGLVDGGVDVINIETMADISEMRAALIAAREITDLPIIAQMTFAERGRTVLGTDPLTAVTVMESLGANVVGANCSGGPEELYPVMEIMASKASRPLVVKPNAGLPKLVEGETVFPASPEDMARYAVRFAELGVRIIGGCCGNTPAHIAAIRKALTDIDVVVRSTEPVSRLCSRTHTVEIKPPYLPVVIGERINPTGKKKLAESLREENMDLVRNLAKQQERQGAELLDVNVGAAGIDEEKVLVQAVQTISGVVHCPLVFDSTQKSVFEKILRIYPGKALVNSVTGEKEKLQELLPLIKRYGAAVIGLTMDEQGIPTDAQTRLEIAERIVREAEHYGISKEDIYIDCLVMTAAAQPEAAEETLKAVRLVHDQLQVKTVLGISNVSHGLPGRDVLNSVFLGAALSSGLDMVIADPSSSSIQQTITAWRVLSGQDHGARRFIERFQTTERQEPAQDQNSIHSPSAALRQAILDGDRASAVRSSQQCAEQGDDPLVVIDQVLIPALEKVGEYYEQGQFFLPQLLLAAEAAEGAVKLLKDTMQAGSLRSKGTIVLATVKGDIHDIGKNIVSILLENHGYRVIDLGKDVSKEKIAVVATAEKADIIGLSALMTTTMLKMKETIAYLKAQQIESAVMVGGAVITPEFAESAGADAYGADAQDAVRTAASLMTLRKEEIMNKKMS